MTLKYYLKYLTVVTHHLESLLIVNSINISITFLFIPTHIKGQELEYHRFYIVRPKQQHHRLLPFSTANASHGNPPLTHELFHQHLAHGCDTTLDKMCIDQTMAGLPTRPFPKHHCPCPICALASFTSPLHGKFFDTPQLHYGQLLQRDFSFWNIVFIRGFTSIYPSLMPAPICLGSSAPLTNTHHSTTLTTIFICRNLKVSHYIQPGLMKMVLLLIVQSSPTFYFFIT